jgi:hypothetical protein
MEKHSNGCARLHPTSGAVGNGTFFNSKSRPPIRLVQFSKAHWQPVLDLLEFLPSLYPNGDRWLENRLAEVLGRQATCIRTWHEHGESSSFLFILNTTPSFYPTQYCGRNLPKTLWKIVPIAMPSEKPTSPVQSAAIWRPEILLFFTEPRPVGTRITPQSRRHSE